MKKLLILISVLLSVILYSQEPTLKVTKPIVYTNSITIKQGATNGYVLTSDSFGGATWEAGGGGAGWQPNSLPLNLILQDSSVNFNLVSGKYNVLYDTSGGIFMNDTIILPASPSDKDVVEFKILVNTMSGTIYVNPNGSYAQLSNGAPASSTAAYNMANFNYAKWQYDATTNTWY